VSTAGIKSSWLQQRSIESSTHFVFIGLEQLLLPRCWTEERRGGGRNRSPSRPSPPGLRFLNHRSICIADLGIGTSPPLLYLLVQVLLICESCDSEFWMMLISSVRASMLRWSASDLWIMCFWILDDICWFHQFMLPCFLTGTYSLFTSLRFPSSCQNKKSYDQEMNSIG
jgi:hypothetical protein